MVAALAWLGWAAGWLTLALSAAAVGYTVYASIAVRRFARAPLPRSARPEPVTLLKPLHGLEPRLDENLRSFLDQHWPAPIQLVAGTNRADDPALAIARNLPGDVAVRSDAPPLGANAKIANLANLQPAAAHDLVVLSDSDMAVSPDYLVRVVAALAQPGVGAVTCLYRGRGDAGDWSRFAAAAISYQFLPSVLMSLALDIERPCMGSTIALRRDTLARIGGWGRFADTLADDYAIGAAVRDLGLTVAVAPRLVIAHGCTETGFAALWRHELRWASTLRAVNGLAYCGVLLTYPLPLALLASLWWPAAGLAATLAALVARIALARAVDRLCEAPTAPLGWLPARDLLSFVVFVASFFARSVDWRGKALRMRAKGRIEAKEIP